jgi:penicillin-insensitive murein endopeptidase
MAAALALASPAAGAGAAGGPAPGPVRIVGANGAGCIAGAVELPTDGPGFQEIRRGVSTFWGHPRTIAALETLAREAQQAGLPDLYMNDIAAPRGGPIASHAGHEIGLEADVWLDVTPKPALSPAERETLEPPSVVRADGRAVDPAVWQPAHATLLRLAAELPGVERILVNPAIKKELCDTVTGDRGWLRLIRPWYGHASHFHIRFRCPSDQKECIEPAPPPQGDGCDASLQWWFDQLDHPQPPSTPHARPALPAACRDILAEPSR